MGGCPARPPGYPAGHVISMGAAVSAISGALVCTVGASRMLCALARDGAGPSPLAAVSARHAAVHCPQRGKGSITPASRIVDLTPLSQRPLLGPARAAGAQYQLDIAGRGENSHRLGSGL